MEARKSKWGGGGGKIGPPKRKMQKFRNERRSICDPLTRSGLFGGRGRWDARGSRASEKKRKKEGKDHCDIKKLDRKLESSDPPLNKPGKI